MSEIQERAAKFMANIVEEKVQNLAKENGIEINKSDNTPTVFEESVKAVTLPKEMNKIQGAANLVKQFMEEETLRNYSRRYENYFINDFLSAVSALIPKYFGLLHVSSRSTSGGAGINEYMQFPVKYVGDQLVTEKGYYGSVKCPVWEDAIMDVMPDGSITVRAKMKFEMQVNQFLEDLDVFVKQFSIVRGQAIRVTKLRFGLMAHPINPKINKDIILAEGTERIIANLVIPSLEERGKTSLLFTGDFGTGKTETAIRVGIEGQRLYNRTFIYLENADVFTDLIPYLKNYQAATVFVEDVDQISGGDRDSTMNDLLNQLDGTELKHVNVTFIFTTNNHDKIHPAMRRPGRIDQVIHFDYSDKAAVAKIYRNYAEKSGLAGTDTVDYELAASKTPDKLQGAVVAEIARRAVKYSKNLYKGVITTDRFLDAVESMRNHIEFMRNDQRKDVSAEYMLGHLMFLSMRKAFPKWEEHGDADIAFQDSPYKGLE